jgi:hypothetical protein
MGMAAERQNRQNLRDWLQRHSTLLHDIQWPLIIILGLTSVVLGTLGFWRYYKNYTLLDSFYASLQLISMSSGGVAPPVPWELQISRFLSPLVAAYTFFFALVEIFRDQSQLFRLSLITNHVVICGLSQKGVALVREFRKKNIDTVVIELDEDNSAIETCREWGAIVLNGDARDQVLLLKARLNKARILIAVCDDDGINAKIAMQAKEIVKTKHKNVLTCIIHIVDPQLCRLLREREIEHEKVPAFRLEFFNVFERGAQIMVKEYPPFAQNALQLDKSPHILIIGLGRLGESLVLQAAYNWREEHLTEKPLQITLIDRDVEWKYDSLIVRYPHLNKLCKIDPIRMDVRSPEFLRGDFLFDRQGVCEIDGIFICMENDSLNLNTALTLLRRLRPQALPIIIRMSEGAGLAALLEGDEGSDSIFRHLHAFGLLDRTCTAEILLGGIHERMARALHEEYVRSEEKKGETVSSNPALVPWEKLPEHLREANRRQVDHLSAELKAAGYGISPLADWDAPTVSLTGEQIEAISKLEHQFWCEDLRKNGWTFAPPSRDSLRKTHPDLVAWEELAESEKEKNRNMVRNIPIFLAQAGFQVERLKSERAKSLTI